MPCQVVWGNPPLGPARATSLLTWTSPPPPPAAAVVASPFAQYDWPNPRGLARSAQGWTQSSPIHLLPPVRSYDWPNPRGAQWPADLRTWARGPQPTEVVATPVVPVDWPNPRGPARSTDLLTWARGPQPTAEEARPASQYDWPNPRGAVRVIDLLRWSQPGILPQPRPDGGTSFDLPPRGAGPAIGLRTWTQGPQPVELVVGNPFFQTEWPNPRGPRWPVSLLTWTQPGFLPQPVVPPTPVSPIVSIGSPAGLRVGPYGRKPKKRRKTWEQVFEPNTPPLAETRPADLPTVNIDYNLSSLIGTWRAQVELTDEDDEEMKLIAFLASVL